jgi:hypothetical protein
VVLAERSQTSFEMHTEKIVVLYAEDQDFIPGQGITID